MRKAYPQVDRVDVIWVQNDNVRVVQASYPGDPDQQFARAKFEAPARAQQPLLPLIRSAKIALAGDDREARTERAGFDAIHAQDDLFERGDAERLQIGNATGGGKFGGEHFIVQIL